MSLTLHLGVQDIPYGHNPQGVTTGDVAGWLEGRYHVMETFVALHEAEVARALEEGLRDSMETLLMGAPTQLDVFGAATSEIKHQFTTFLESGEMEHLGIPGVPTQAARRRRSLRHKRKKSRGPRPSFIDTGLYETSFTSWVD